MNPTQRPILLVEDNEDDVFFMQRAIKAADITLPVQIARSGQAAIDYLSGAGPFADRSTYPLPRIVFLDLKMPGKSGIEVLQWIRTESSLPGLIVLILTSSREDSDVQRAYRLGVNSYLVKPPNSAELNVLIKLVKSFWLENTQLALPPNATVCP